MTPQRTRKGLALPSKMLGVEAEATAGSSYTARKELIRRQHRLQLRSKIFGEEEGQRK